MAKRQKTTDPTKALNKVKHRSRRYNVSSLLLLIGVCLAGGSLLAVLIYLQSNGLLSDIFTFIKEYFDAKEVESVLIVFWLLIIPLLLIFILAVNTARRKKFSHYRKSWEEIFKIAIEEERKAFEEKQAREEHTKRFASLNEIAPETAKPSGREIGSLQELCEKFRLFAANTMHLYYTEAQVREFVASLAVSHILILQGMSGTGKTSLTYAFGEFIKKPATIIPVQPMWKERSDLLGYYNEFTKKYNETPLLRKMYEANGSGSMFITVLDEMNIARVEYYFAEFLSLLEIPDPELRYLEVVPDRWEDDPEGLKDGRIRLPENMWFIGTVNNDDSTFAISDKVYDRAMIIDLDRRTAPFGTEETVPPLSVSYAEFTALARRAQAGYELTKRNERRLKELDEFLISKFQITFGNRIMRQIKNYIAVYIGCGGDELEALDDILAKKVLRKLTYKDLSLLRKELREASDFLETVFGKGNMPNCRDYLARVGRI